jgi:HPr kinase/phosphorylase
VDQITYLASLAPAERKKSFELFFFPIPAVFVTKGNDCRRAGETAAAAGVPSFEPTQDGRVLSAHQASAGMGCADNLATWVAGGRFRRQAFLHRQSGIGKSECVLDLVERGHRLVADDLVITSKRGNDVLIGRGHEMQRHYMEIRGIGLIDIKAIFGIRAVRQQKRIEVVVQLEEWDQNAVVERVGLDMETTEILDVELPKVTVYLNPGKNITVVAEVIAMNHLLRYSGVNAAEAFNERLLGRMKTAAANNIREYLQEDHE